MEDLNKPSGAIGSTFRLSLDNPDARFSTLVVFYRQTKNKEIEGDDV